MNNFMRYIFLIQLFVLVTVVIHAQESNTEESKKKDMGLVNTVTVGVGRAHHITGSESFSNLGFDYLRRFNPKWEWGIQLDLDWEKNFVEFEGVQVAGIIAYSITQKWPVFGGLGIANEEEHTEGFIRVGTEYTFFLDKKKRLFIAPGTFLDTNKDGVTPSLLLALGWMW